MLKFQPAGLLLGLVAFPATSRAQIPEQRLDAWLAPLVQAGLFSGTILVARGDSVVYLRSFGYADRELGVPLTPAHRSNIASITKPLTLVLFCRLAGQGVLAPDQRLSRWLPSFPRGDEITLDHLINHRAGIPHRVTTPEQETVPRTASDMVGLASQAPLLFTPGERSVYSSAGFSVLARVMEVAGGADYGTLMQREVFAPAGAVHSLHPVGRTLMPGRARAYVWGEGGLSNAPLADLSFLVGAGSVYSTADDLFRITRHLVAGGYGDLAQQALLREKGLAWNGSTNGYRAWLDWVRDGDMTYILTANQQSGVNDLLRQNLPALWSGRAVAPVPIPTLTPGPVTRATLARLEGHYAPPNRAALRVRASEGGLLIGQWWLIAQTDSTFFSPNDFGEVTFRPAREGGAELEWKNGGTGVVWKRQ